MTKILLASGSPRRREILSDLGVSLTVVSADTDETCAIPEPCAYAEELARRKGQAAWEAVKLRLKEGIDDTDARALLTTAFLNEVLDGIEDESVRAEFERLADEGLKK